MTAGQTAKSQIGEEASRYTHNVKNSGSIPLSATRNKNYG